MIQANELRIGNWVSFKGLWNGVAEKITPYSLEVKGNDNFYPVDCFQGIPLTPEILEKLPTWFGSNTFELRGNFNNTASVYAWAHGNSIFICDVQYLHQLQNLYFALTGEELNVQL